VPDLEPSPSEGEYVLRPSRPSPLRFLALALAWVLIVAVATAAAYVYGNRGEKTYGARVDILYVPAQDTPDDARERILATQRELLLSRGVLAPVAKEVGVPLDQLRGAIEVDVGLDDLMRITVGDRDPQRALVHAQALTDRYLDVTSGLTREDAAARSLLQREIRELTRRERRVTDEFEAGQLRDRIGRLRDRLLEVEVESLGDEKAEVLSEPYLLGSPIAPNPRRSAAVGLLAGLVLATATVVLLARMTSVPRGR